MNFFKKKIRQQQLRPDLVTLHRQPLKKKLGGKSLGKTFLPLEPGSQLIIWVYPAECFFIENLRGLLSEFIIKKNILPMPKPPLASHLQALTALPRPTAV